MNNWYIDFDSTLYDTPKLIEDMLNTLAKQISQKKKIDESSILEEITPMFNRQNIYNIFSLCTFLENKYLLKTNSLSSKINLVLNNGSKYVYDDVIPFLESLKSKKCKIYMLTFSTFPENTDFQMQKISGAGITRYFDSIIVTATLKHTLDLNYENGIFIDDNPKDLQNLYNSNAKKVIRIKREGNKYSSKILNNPEIHEYTTLSEIFYKEEELIL